MPEPTMYADILRKEFQSYYEFIIKESSCGEYKDYHEAYNEKLKPYIEILAKENLLLSMPDGKKITCFEDVKALDREMFHCWPYYSYEEMKKKKYYTLGTVGSRKRRIYNSSLMNNRSAKLKEYFHIQYADCLKKLDAIERGIQPESTPEVQKRKLPRGQKKPYADQKKYTEFLQSINNKCNGTLSQKTNMAISEMEGRGLFLDGNTRPIYTKKTIKKHLSQLKKDHILLSNLKSNGKVTESNKVTQKMK